MISLDNAVIARYEHSNETFEVLVDPDNAWKVKHGDDVPLEDIVASREVYSDSKKGKRASESALNKVFGTNDFDKIAVKIIRDGDIHLTTEQRKKMQEEKRRNVINLIARNAVDPRTHAPHPAARIEKAMDESGIHIDPFKRADEQLEAALDSIRKILPIKLETVRIVVKIPAEHAARIYSFIRKYKTLSEEWKSDGTFMASVEIPAGMQGDFLDRLNRLTSGENEVKVMERF